MGVIAMSALSSTIANYDASVIYYCMETIGERIEKARRLRAWSQSDLAAAIGFPSNHQSRVSRWERGDGFPSLAQVVAIADATGVTLDYLLRGAEPEPMQALTDEERSVLKLFHALGVTEDQALRALALAAAEGRPPASGPARQLGVRVTTEHHQRLDRDRVEAAAKAAAKAAEAAREKQAANSVGGKSSA